MSLAGRTALTRGTGLGRSTGLSRGAGLVLAGGVLAAGCGSASGGHPAAAPAARPAALPLMTSLAAGQVTWAVVPMGTAGPNLFWQLFRLGRGGSRWTLATPPDVSTNGAIALGASAGQALVAGIHPSLYLSFSPVTSTLNGGRTWRADAPDQGLASVPDALAAAPSGAGLIALTSHGRAEVSGAALTGAALTGAAVPGGAGRAGATTAASTRAVAITAAGRACGLRELTAVAFTPAGAPMLGGGCRRAGVAGLFSYQDGTWQAAGPALPGSLRREAVTVLRLTRAGRQITALLQAGTGQARSLISASAQASGSAAGPGHAGRAGISGESAWTLSAPFRLGGRMVLSSSFGSSGVAVALSGRRGEFLARPGAAWQPLPELPAGPSVTLALPPGGGVEALGAAGSVLTVWRLRAGAAAGGAGGSAAGAWSRIQQTRVPIQYGSSS